MIIKTNIPIVWLRWLLILPVSVSFPILIDWLVRLAFEISLDSTLETSIIRCLIMLISTIGSVLLAYSVAPSNKLRMSITIAALWILVLTAGLIIVIGRIEIYGQEQTILDGGVSSISMLIGLSIGLLTARKLANCSDYAKRKLD